MSTDVMQNRRSEREKRGEERKPDNEANAWCEAPKGVWEAYIYKHSTIGLGAFDILHGSIWEKLNFGIQWLHMGLIFHFCFIPILNLTSTLTLLQSLYGPPTESHQSLMHLMHIAIRTEPRLVERIGCCTKGQNMYWKIDKVKSNPPYLISDHW